MPEFTNDEAGRPAPGHDVGRPHDSSPGTDTGPAATAGGRLEGTAIGRALISVVVVFTIGTFLTSNLPDSELKRNLGPLTQTYMNLTGLDQNWSVFVTPRTMSAYVYARVDYATGPSSDVPFPKGRGMSAYVDYRWQKYEELVRPDSGQRLWAACAEYVADRARDEGREPVRVSLIRRWADSNPPGTGTERTPWREFTFYTMSVGQPS